jgi:DNA-directed RNA polymerase subunit M/transcription elongation factor TFIIS
MLGFRLPTAAAIATKRPSCPKCETMMMPARIEPYSSEYRKRTFECPSCHHSESALVKLT